MPIICAFHHLKIGDKLKNLNMVNGSGLQTKPTEPCTRLKHVDTLTHKNGFEHGTSKLSMVPFDFRKKEENNMKILEKQKVNDYFVWSCPVYLPSFSLVRLIPGTGFQQQLGMLIQAQRGTSY